MAISSVVKNFRDGTISIEDNRELQCFEQLEDKRLGFLYHSDSGTDYDSLFVLAEAKD